MNQKATPRRRHTENPFRIETIVETGSFRTRIVTVELKDRNPIDRHRGEPLGFFTRTVPILETEGAEILELIEAEDLKYHPTREAAEDFHFARFDEVRS